jgi:hypothetical protein
VPRVATIPLAGGPEFDSLNEYPICGAPAPQSQPQAQGFSIAAAVGPGTDPWLDENTEWLSASVSYDADEPREPGPSSRGPLWLLLVADGKIAGATPFDGAQLHESVTPDLASQTFGIPAYSDFFACRRLSLRGPREYDLFPVDPGTYTVVAYTRIFSTVESVALSQALPVRFRLDESAQQPGGVYLPGSYDCTVLESRDQMVRACLPDVVTSAQLDDDRQILSVLYDPSGLAEPFDITLMSEPLDITLTSWADARGEDGNAVVSTGDATRFASAADVVCGAVANDFQGFEPTGESRFDTDSGRDDVDIEAWSASAEVGEPHLVEARVMPWLAPDGSSVRLELGSRLVYLKYRGITPDLGWPEYEVVGFATIEMLGAISYDRYRGPTRVQLIVREPERCPGIDDGMLLDTDTAILGTWTITPPDGPETTRELISTTSAWLPTPGDNGPGN